MEAKLKTENIPSHVLTLKLTEQDRLDLIYIVGFDITIPDAVSPLPTDPRRVRIEAMLAALQSALVGV